MSTDSVVRVWASIVLLMLAIGVANAQVPSELKRLGYNGPVRTVKTEFIDYYWANSRWHPRDPIYDLERFDRNGHRLTTDIDPGSGWRAYGVARPPTTSAGPRQYELVRKRGKSGLGWKTVWQFDQQDRLELFRAYGIYESGPELSQWQHYSYDVQGRVEQLTYWADWGREPDRTKPYPPKRLKYWFDEAGRFGGWTDPEKPESRSTLTYDKEGRLVKQVDQNESGHIMTQTWEGYDQQGNWTTTTIINSWRADLEEEPDSKNVWRRSITYRRASTKNPVSTTSR